MEKDVAFAYIKRHSSCELVLFDGLLDPTAEHRLLERLVQLNLGLLIVESQILGVRVHGRRLVIARHLPHLQIQTQHLGLAQLRRQAGLEFPGRRVDHLKHTSGRLHPSEGERRGLLS